MARQHQQEKEKDGEEEQHQRRYAVIQGQVMGILGTPRDLQLVQVRRLWDDHYRVNVLVGADYASARVGHSYFLVADDDGKILSCTPQISKQYQRRES